jgi:hypothetical protein
MKHVAAVKPPDSETRNSAVNQNPLSFYSDPDLTTNLRVESRRASQAENDGKDLAEDKDDRVKSKEGTSRNKGVTNGDQPVSFYSDPDLTTNMRHQLRQHEVSPEKQAHDQVQTESKEFVIA